MNGSDNLPVGPGILGFIAVFVLALALWLLMRNMNARMRRMAYRDRDRSGDEARAERDAATSPAGSGAGPDRSAAEELAPEGLAQDGHRRPDDDDQETAP